MERFLVKESLPLGYSDPVSVRYDLDVEGTIERDLHGDGELGVGLFLHV